MWYNLAKTEDGDVMATRILLVDDTVEMAWLLKSALAKEDFEIAVARDGAEGLRQAYAFQPDLVVLDVMMPGMNGWDMLRRLREFSDVPVIMLTAVSDSGSRVQGLDIGADDYVSKPFEVRELRARIRAALRRAALSASDSSQPLRLDSGNLIIDLSSQAVMVRGEPVDLTPTEFKLLLCLASNAGQVLTYDQILDNVWGPGYGDSAASVKVYIRRLRRKIEVDPSNPRLILTQWGVGYSLVRT
jgi:two-component system KDP operon response regulator KdpE